MCGAPGSSEKVLLQVCVRESEKERERERVEIFNIIIHFIHIVCEFNPHHQSSHSFSDFFFEIEVEKT